MNQDAMSYDELVEHCAYLEKMLEDYKFEGDGARARVVWNYLRRVHGKRVAHARIVSKILVTLSDSERVGYNRFEAIVWPHGDIPDSAINALRVYISDTRRVLPVGGITAIHGWGYEMSQEARDWVKNIKEYN